MKNRDKYFGKRVKVFGRKKREETKKNKNAWLSEEAEKDSKD